MSKSHLTPMKRLIHKLLKIYLESIFDIEVKRNATKNLEGPYLIIGNHQNNWDGFIMNIYIDEPIVFIVSDEQFRNSILRALLNYIDAIPTVKAKSDFITIKRVIKAKKENRIIGLFPEGNRTWDGKTQPISYSTAKLIKLLKIPVIASKSQGGHLASPRWAKKRRKGKIIFSYDLLFSVDELESLSLDQIYQRLISSLTHDEYSFQEKQMYQYKGKKLAERLENFLFTCPECKTIDQMKSSGDKFFCKKCGYTVKYNSFGYFESERIYFANPRDWNSWQLKLMEVQIQQAISSKNKIMLESKVLLKQGEKYKPLKKINIGEISLDSSHFYFHTDNGEELKIPVGNLDGLNLQVRNQLDFYYKNQIYRFNFNKKGGSPFKWLHALQMVQKDRKNHEFLSKA